MEPTGGCEELKSILEDVRRTEIKGRKGGMFVYAGAIYRYFEDIRDLKAEGYTFATICKFLEEKNILPTDSDQRSFCRAFRKEVARRKLAAKAKKTEGIHDTVISPNKPKGNAAREVSAASAIQRTGVVPAKPMPDRTGLQVNTDNTFNIRPIDLNDLPDPSSIR
ncbi:hypothetical protein FACS1894216_05160 [Synergistales bacterium]|nr:hypothetical protein FACS1894216_05160 [Synergistales bacterium]